MRAGEFETNRIELEITSVEEFGRENLCLLEVSYRLLLSHHELSCVAYSCGNVKNMLEMTA